MQPHQQRVVDEHNALGEKLSKLNAFFDTDTFAALPEVERILLLTQKDVMTAYLSILIRRIGLFG